MCFLLLAEMAPTVAYGIHPAQPRPVCGHYEISELTVFDAVLAIIQEACFLVEVKKRHGQGSSFIY